MVVWWGGARELWMAATTETQWVALMGYAMADEKAALKVVSKGL